MAFRYHTTGGATTAYVDSSVETLAATLRAERDALIDAINPERRVGPAGGYLATDSPVTSPAGEKNNYFVAWEPVTIDGTVYPAKTVFTITEDTEGGDPNKYDIDIIETRKLRASSGIDLLIGTIADDDNITSAERLAGVSVAITSDGIPDGVKATVTITDVNNVVITKTPAVSANSTSFVLSDSDLSAMQGPLQITAIATYAGNTAENSKIVTMAEIVFAVDPIAGDDFIDLDEANSAVDITGIAPPAASVAISGSFAINVIANSDGNWSATIPVEGVRLYVADTDLPFHFDTLGQPRITRIVRKASAAASQPAPTALTITPDAIINPASPISRNVKVDHSNTAGLVIRLRATRNGSELWSQEKTNNSGSATNFTVSSAQVGLMVSPAKWEARQEYNGTVSPWLEVAATYAQVNDPVTGDPLPTSISTIDFPTSGQNFHRKNTGFSEFMYRQNGVDKELHGWFAENGHWYAGNRLFPDGQITNYRDIHSQCNLTSRDDNHNTCSVATTAAGTFLMIADIHAHDVQGGYTTSAYDDTFASMVPITKSMFPNNSVDRVTYPQFFEFKGHTYLFMRELDSGGGTPNFISRIFRWRETEKDFVIAIDLNAGVKLRNYVSNFAISPDGQRLGFVGLFRDDGTQPNGTAQQKDIYYLYTDSDLSQGSPVFRSADGTVQQMPVLWDNGLGKEGVTSYLVNDKIFDTSPDPIPNKPGSLIFDQNNQPHIFTDLKDGNKYYCYRNAGNTAWVKRVMTFNESSSAMVGYGGVIGFGVHTGTDFRFYPADEDDPNYQSGILLADNFYSGGAFVYRPNYQAMYKGYLTMNLFKNKSSGTGTSGSYITSMKHRVVPFSQLGVEIVDAPLSVQLFVDPIAGDGTVDDTEAANPITIIGSVEEAATVSFNGPFTIEPITLTTDGPFETPDISQNILEERSGDVIVTATTPDGRTASVTRPFSVPTDPITVPLYEPVGGVSIINNTEGLAGHTFEGRAAGSNGKTATFTHSLSTVAIPDYIVANGLFNIELPASEIAKTEDANRYTIDIDIDGETGQMQYENHRLDFPGILDHDRYNPGEAFNLSLGTVSERGPWKFGIRITDTTPSENELWPYREIQSDVKPVEFNITDSETSAWPQTIRVHYDNENVYRNRRSETRDITASLPITMNLSEPSFAFDTKTTKEELDSLFGADVRYVINPEGIAWDNFAVDGTVDVGEPKALRIRMVPGSTGSDPVHASVTLPTPAKKLKLVQDMLFETGYEGGDTYVGAKVGFGMRPAKSVAGGSRDTDGFSCISMLRHTGNRNNKTSEWTLEAYVYSANRPGMEQDNTDPVYGESIKCPFVVPIGQRFTVEITLGVNSAHHLSDGTLQYKINGQEMFSRNNIQWMTSGALEIEDYDMRVFHGGSSAAWSPPYTTYMQIRGLEAEVIE